MIVLDISIVITALPKLQVELGFTETGLSWLQNAYTLVLGGFLLLGARAGDIMGRRRMFIVGIAIFTIASPGDRLGSLRDLADRRPHIAGSRSRDFDTVDASTPYRKLPGRAGPDARSGVLRSRRRRRRQSRSCPWRSPSRLAFLASQFLHQCTDRHRHDTSRASLPC
jgi:hypothetical protein